MMIDAAEFERTLKQSMHETGVSVDPTKDMSPEDAAEWKRQNEKHKDKFKSAAVSIADYEAELDKESKFERGENVSLDELPTELQENVENPPPAVTKLREEMESKSATDKEAAKLQARQIKILKDYLADHQGRFISWFDDLPQEVQSALVRVKDSETLHMDVDRWIQDNNKIAAKRVHFKPGDKLVVKPVPPGLQKSYPASKWMTAQVEVEAIDEGASDGLDVYDVKTPDGEEESIYGFQVVKKVASSEDKTAATGLYGFTKEAEKVCGSASNKLAKFASKLAKEIYEKDAETPSFLEEHNKRTASKAAKMLRASMADIGPGKPAKTAALISDIKRAIQNGLVTGNLNQAISMMEGDFTESEMYRMVLSVDPDMSKRDWAYKLKNGRIKIRSLLASDKTAAKGEKGRYGFSAKTARLALEACNTVEHEAGVIASDLHSRMGSKHASITGFLNKHAKRAKCGWSDLILEAYPAQEQQVIASETTEKTASDLSGYSIHPSVDQILTWEGQGTPREAASFLASDDEEGPLAGRTWDGDKSKPDDAAPYNIHPESPPAGADGSTERKRYNRWFRENVCPGHKTNCGL